MKNKDFIQEILIIDYTIIDNTTLIPKCDSDSPFPTNYIIIVLQQIEPTICKNEIIKFRTIFSHESKL